MLDSTVVTVTLATNGLSGRGEAAGVYYRGGDDAFTAAAQIEALRSEIEAGMTRETLQRLLPAGGARNAVDCALWDLEAKIQGRPAWQLANLAQLKPLVTTFTVGAAAPAEMALIARSYTDAKAIKLKLTGQPEDAERVRAVRNARPEVWLAVDANQGFTPALLDSLLPTLIQERVAQIEQPFPVGKEADLDGLNAPIPIVADESVQTAADLEPLIGKVEVINIKLDKCGGLTEALAMAQRATELGFDLMIGNMLGTSLAMAPACLVGQLCRVVDLDGPIFLRDDRFPAVQYSKGMVSSPEALWGSPK
jgi:L-alanine-DL-glutamate epimerase-like enolase superfamily enzyme